MTFHDSTLYFADLGLFCGGNWLNDHAILFGYEYFQHVEFGDCGDDLLFVHPANTMLLQYGDDEDLNDLSNALQLTKRKLVFIPVNNNSSGLVTNGSHWSLIVYQASTNTFVHFDSMGSSSINLGAASAIVKKLAASVYKGAVYCAGANAPRQRNGYDCGMYLLCISQLLGQYFVEGVNPFKENGRLLKECTPNYVKEMRKTWHELIQKVHDELAPST